MNFLTRWFVAYNNISWIKTLREMFVESCANTTRVKYATKQSRLALKTIRRDVASYDSQITELRQELLETQNLRPKTRREQWFAIPVKTRIIYAHNRWLTTPKILVFTATAESIGIMFQLLHDSLRLARFLKRYEARNCREADYDSNDFTVQARRFDGLRTAPNAYGNDMPILIEWSLRRDPRGPLLIWNYSRDDTSFCPEYRRNVEVLSSRALFGDMPDDDATKQILIDATRRAMGDALFSDVVNDEPKLIMHMRELTRRYSNQPGDPADARLPSDFRNWMKEVDSKTWMQEVRLDPGRPYWEDLPEPQKSGKELTLEKRLQVCERYREQALARIQTLDAGATALDIAAGYWMSFWFGLAIVVLNALFVIGILSGALALTSAIGALIWLIVAGIVMLVKGIINFFTENGKDCCLCIISIFIIYCYLASKK